MRTAILDIFENIGLTTGNVRRALHYIWHSRVDIGETMNQVAKIGFDSLPIALIISLIAGCVLSLHASEKFAMTGANAYVGALVALAMVREMGPIMAALAVGARAGTAMSTEIANMAVTEQLGALRMMHVDPIRYLMAPRLLACLICFPLVTILSVTVGILGGAITAWYIVRIHMSMYLDSVWLQLKTHDIEVCLLKSVVFALFVAGIAITSGLNAKGGARQVGQAATHATVWAAITILISDFFLTWIFFGTSFTS